MSRIAGGKPSLPIFLPLECPALAFMHRRYGVAMKPKNQTALSKRRRAGASPGGATGAVGALRRPAIPHRVLGLPTGESDPVRIITAAHVRLRRWRRLMDRATDGREAVGTVGRVQRIILARDTLLRQVYDLLDPVGQSPHN